MKKLLFLAMTLVMALTITACKKDNSAESAITKIDTSSAERAFQNAPLDVRTDFDRTITAVQAGNTQDALGLLQKLSINPRLTPEQKDAISALMSRVQGAAVDGATKAMDDVKDSLKK